RLLVVAPVGRALHLFGQPADDLVLLALQEKHGVRHILGVGFRPDLAGARRRAALDLVQEARPRAILEHRVLARAQAEDALQELDALAYRVRVRERPEVAVALVLRSAV